MSGDISTVAEKAITACLPNGGSLVVAVSGGADSVCLLHVLIRLRERLNLVLHVAHLNHGLRGKESDDDARFVADLSRNLSIPFTIEKRDIDSYGQTSSVEEKARCARYSFLSDVAASCGAGAVALGHNSDDQVETILMNIVRGSGLSGMCGMKPIGVWSPPGGGTAITIVRPLLDVSRSQIERYCSDNGLTFVVDSSNRSPDYMRNRFRHEIVPLLKQYNAGFEDAFLRLSAVIRDEVALLDGQVSLLWDEVVAGNDGVFNIDREAFAGLEAAVQRLLMREVLKRLIGNLFDVGSVHIEDMCGMMQKPVGKKLMLPHGLVMVNGYERATVGSGDRIDKAVSYLEGEYRLNVPGITSAGTWLIRASLTDDVSEMEEETGLVQLFNSNLAQDELIVRARKEGDRFQPLGMEGSKTLQDFMVDVKIPRPERDAVPLVCCKDRILWVVGYRIDHRARVLPQDKCALKIAFERNTL